VKPIGLICFSRVPSSLPGAANLDVKENPRSFTFVFAAQRGKSEREGKLSLHAVSPYPFWLEPQE
jgi:hypothetical protein